MPTGVWSTVRVRTNPAAARNTRLSPAWKITARSGGISAMPASVVPASAIAGDLRSFLQTSCWRLRDIALQCFDEIPPRPPGPRFAVIERAQRFEYHAARHRASRVTAHAVRHGDKQAIVLIKDGCRIDGQRREAFLFDERTEAIVVIIRLQSLPMVARPAARMSMLSASDGARGRR